MNNTAKTLYEIYKERISKSSCIGDTSDSNILDIIHLSENDHTNILWSILKFKQADKFPFFESFVRNVLGLDITKLCAFISEGSRTQFQAIPIGNSKDASGFIDLVIRVGNKVIIVENKVCGATDANWQLLRYYFSFVEFKSETHSKLVPTIKDKCFQDLYNSYHSNSKTFSKAEDVYLVYLTKDGKEASNNSIGGLQSLINDHYIPISYFGEVCDGRKNLLSWLKHDVLRNLPYLESGTFIKSIVLYIDYLENVMNESNEVVENKYLSDKDWIEAISKFEIKDLIEDYSYYRNLKGVEDKDNEDCTIVDKYMKFLKAGINYKLTNILGCIKENWVIRWTPAYIKLYKKEWMGIFPESSTTCLAHWELLKDMDHDKPDFKWEFHLEGAELSQYASQINEKIIHASLVTKGGHMKNVFHFENSCKSYILKNNDEIINDYFSTMLNNTEFEELTNTIISEVQKLMNKEKIQFIPQ